MNSQGIPSTEVLSLISDVTEPDEVSGDVNAYFQKITFPETGKTVYKCSFCEKSWETIVSTARKGHLANHQLAKLYSTTRCPMVPKNVSLFFIETLNTMEALYQNYNIWQSTYFQLRYQTILRRKTGRITKIVAPRRDQVYCPKQSTS